MEKTKLLTLDENIQEHPMLSFIEVFNISKQRADELDDFIIALIERKGGCFSTLEAVENAVSTTNELAYSMLILGTLITKEIIEKKTGQKIDF